jgi:hypothetical protein
MKSSRPSAPTRTDATPTGATSSAARRAQQLEAIAVGLDARPASRRDRELVCGIHPRRCASSPPKARRHHEGTAHAAWAVGTVAN